MNAFDAPFPDLGSEVPVAVATAEAEAALALGRLDGAFGACPAPVARIFAGLVVRSALTRALAQEGHAFTEQRFDAWFAGLVPLADGEATALPRSAKVIADIILAELAHSIWPPIAECARMLRPALMAGRDLAAPDAHEDTHATIADARALIADLGAQTSPLPFAALGRLHALVQRSARFAPAESATTIIQVGDRQLSLERTLDRSPRWALDLVYGELLRATGFLTAALPCPGLVRLDALPDVDGSVSTDGPAMAQIIRAGALRDVALEHLANLARARDCAAWIGDGLSSLRASSRAPALCELLAGFGAMRSAQIEAVLGKTRLGVRAILNTLFEAGLVTRTSVSGVWLYRFTPPSPQAEASVEQHSSFAFSSEMLGEYEAANAEIDRLLAGMEVETDSHLD